VSDNSLKTKTLSGLFWKFSENFGSQIINFIITIIIARILMPSDYGTIAIVTVFISIANVFLQTGFSSALIQKKDANIAVYSSVFYSSVIISVFLYIIIFFLAPIIADYYSNSLLKNLLRIQSISIILTSFVTVQNAIIVKNFLFRKNFIFRLIGALIQGSVGIYLAMNNYGAWALVISNVTGTFIVTVLIWFMIDWKPKLVFSFTSLNEILPYSYRILMSSLLNNLFQNMKSLIIGRVYDQTTLGYYSKGFQIPTLLMTNIDGAISSVSFPLFSRYQDNLSEFLLIYRRSLKMSIFLVFPMMFGLTIIAETITIILLTEKWLPIVPFIQIISLSILIWPFSIRFNAFNALGLSKLSLRLNFIEILLASISMIISIRFGVIVFVISSLVGSYISLIIGSIFIQKVFLYNFKNQIADILPTLLLSIFMSIFIFLLGLLFNNIYIKLTVQLISGILFYLFFALIFKMGAIIYLKKLYVSYKTKT
jgi:O-antigen/teichoic acid export membrane protein